MSGKSGLSGVDSLLFCPVDQNTTLRKGRDDFQFRRRIAFYYFTCISISNAVEWLN